MGDASEISALVALSSHFALALKMNDTYRGSERNFGGATPAAPP